MFRIKQRVLTIGALVILVIGTMPAAPTTYAQAKQCFVETNQCIEGRFLEYWQQSGGLSVFGFPIGAAQNETNRDTGKVYLTQWFERNRFELHPENARPYDVLLGRLGEDTLITQGRDWRNEYTPPTQPLLAGCEAISTGDRIFTLCPPFRDYYRSHGLEFDGRPGYEPNESLALFGLPLTQPRTETNSSGDTVLTQWFERARMEYHPNNPVPYTVLLGLLGNEIKGRTQPSPSLKAAITFIRADGTIGQTDGTSTQIIDRSYGPGKALAALREGNRMTVLHEGGLMRVNIGTEDQTIATFTRGNAIFGSLVAPRNTTKILYNYARQPIGPDAMFLDGVAGVIEGTTARKIHNAPNPMQVLGVSADERAMLVINQGGDPSYLGVQLISIATGQVLTTLPFGGDGVPALSPNRRIIGTPFTRDGHADMVVLYDLNNQTGAPRNVPVGRTGWNITQLKWSNDSAMVYALAYPSTDMPKGELWRIDPATRKSTLVASNLPTDSTLIGVTDDNATLIAQQTGSAMLLNLQNGQRTIYSIPQDAVVASWR